MSRRAACRLIGTATIVAACHLPLPALAADGGDGLRKAGRLQDTVDRAIRPLMAEHDVPGMAVAVTVDGESAVFNYGLASRQANTPVGERTLFEIGSLSKTFTATLAGFAQATGKLDLDDHPSRYLPPLEGSAIDKASLLHLGTFTAGGLPLQFPDAISGGDGLIDFLRQWKPEAGPGERRRYSNPSIGLLGHVAGIALGTGFTDAVESRLFPALGLRHSHIRVPDGARADYAWGYDRSNKPVRVNPGLFDAEAYGVRSTAGDMIRFVQANIDPSRLDGPLRIAVETTHRGFFRVGEMVQGLGWEQYSYPVPLERLLAGNAPTMILESNPATAIPAAPVPAQAAPVPAQAAAAPVPAQAILFNKTGSTNGFGAYAAFVPQKRIGIVMLANRNFPIPARIAAAHDILRQLAR